MKSKGKRWLRELTVRAKTGWEGRFNQGASEERRGDGDGRKECLHDLQLQKSYTNIYLVKNYDPFVSLCVPMQDGRSCKNEEVTLLNVEFLKMIGPIREDGSVATGRDQSRLCFKCVQ
jgi:hypothetical protein